MNGQMVLDKIMDTYRPNFDVEEPYEFHGEVYDAYAGFSMTSAKYVLVKRAELWRAHCFEHAFFQCREEIHAGDLLRFPGAAPGAYGAGAGQGRGGRAC